MGIIFRRRYENMYDIIKQNNGLVVVYGVKCAEVLWKKMPFRIDYFVDRRGEEIRQIHDIQVLTPNQFEEIARTSDKRATIIICVDFHPSVVTRSIYEDIVKLDVNADVFDYFACDVNFEIDSFVYKDERYSLYEHSFNCGYCDTRMTERSVELPLVKKWIKECEGEIVEVGAVTPYYFSEAKITEIIDPTDLHTSVTEHKSIFECNLKNRNVICISTIEHIGTDDYGLNIQDSSVEALFKVLNESKKCFVTFPLGYNRELDEWILANRNNEMVSILTRGMNNDWSELKNDEEIYTPYLLFFGASGLAIIEK